MPRFPTDLANEPSGLGRPLIYTSPSFGNTLPATADLASKADLWVAHWAAQEPASVPGWKKWTFWQFTNKATVAGISGTAGIDEDWFNGSVPELHAYSADFVAARSRNDVIKNCDDAKS